MAGPWDDYAPQSKAASGPWDDFKVDNRGIVQKLTDPFRHGAAQLLGGEANTLHETGNDSVVFSGMQSVAKMAEPSDYTPSHVTLDPRTWGDIPKAVAEASPGLAQDMAAGGAGAAAGGALGSVVPVVGTAAGSVIGGGVGAIGSYLARNYGNDVRSSVRASGGNDSTEPTATDKAKALLQGTAGGILSRVGLQGALGVPVKAGAQGLARQLIPQIAKGAAYDAATGVAQEGLHQGLIDQKFDPEALGGAAVTGAATGAAIRTAHAGKDIAAAHRFGDLTPQEAAPVANMLMDAAGPNAKYNGTADYHAVKKVQDDLAVRAQALSGDSNVTGHLKSLQEADQHDNTKEVLGRVKTDIAEGRAPAQPDMEHLQSTLGAFPHGADLVETLNHQAVLNKIKALGKFDDNSKSFTSGLSGSDFAQKYISPVGKLGGYLDAGAIAVGALGHTLPGLHWLTAATSAGPWGALAIPAAQVGVFGGLHAIDALTGNRSPTQQFVRRFGGTGDTPGQPGVPSGPAPGPAFNDVMNKARAQAAAQKAAQRPQATGGNAPARPTPAPANPQVVHQQVVQQGNPQAAMARQQVNQQQALQTAQARTQAAPTLPQVLPPQLVAHANALAQAVAASKAAAVAQGAAQRAVQAPQAIPVPPRLPKAPTGAPEAVAPPSSTITIQTKHGPVKRDTASIRGKQSAYIEGVHDKVDTRNNVMEDAAKLPLSEAGQKTLATSRGEVLNRVLHVKTPAAAEKAMESHFLNKFSEHDAKLIRAYLMSKLDPQTGRTFYDTWSQTE